MNKILSLFFMALVASTLHGQTPRYANVQDFNGKPSLFVDGTQVTPDFYALTHAYGGRWSWEEVPQRNIKNFCSGGFRLFQADLYFEDIWRKNADTLDMTLVRRQIRGILDVCPEAGIVIRIHVNAPYWWNEMHKEECTEYADGPVDDRDYGPPFNLEDGDVERPLRASLASKLWRREAGDKLVEFCKRLSTSPEGNAIIGLHMSGGIYGEWHYWGFIDHDPDTGPAMTTRFREWLREKYRTKDALQTAWNSGKYDFTNAVVPGLSEREFTSDGIFRNPEKEQHVIDYYTCQQESVADDIEFFCRIAKENWPRPLLVGVFYGYFHMTFCRQAAGGHLFIERILDSPWIDYLSAPQSYWGKAREVGGSGNSRGIIESALLHGKLWLDEMDNGFLQKNTGYDNIRITTAPDSSYLPILKRAAIYPLMRGTGLWYYDFGLQKSFGWWDRPAYMENIANEKLFFDARLKVPYHSPADVLFVWSMESFYYVADGRTPVCYSQLDEAPEEAFRCGVTGDHIYLFDLEKIDLDPYKAVVFMNTYKVGKKMKDFIRKRVATDGRTLIWNYMPGYTDGRKLDLNFVRNLTGIKIRRIDKAGAPVVELKNPSSEYAFDGPVSPLVMITDPDVEILGTLSGSDTVMVARKKYRDFQVVYATLPLHGTDVFRKLFGDAGCHVYNESNDFTYARSGLILIHTLNGGRRVIHLINGKDIPMVISPRSSTVLDAENGKILLR